MIFFCVSLLDSYFTCVQTAKITHPCLLFCLWIDPPVPLLMSANPRLLWAVLHQYALFNTVCYTTYKSTFPFLGLLHILLVHVNLTVCYYFQKANSILYLPH